MKAICIDEFGGRDVLKIVDMEMPKPSNHEVLVKVLSTSVNFADIKTRTGKYHAAGKTPLILGLEVVGVVVQIGGLVNGFDVGDYIIGFPKKGAYTQYTVIESPLVYKISSQQVHKYHGAPLVSFTSYFMINKLSKLMPNEVILVHGAAGGVGTTAIQIAKNIGAKVIGVVSSNDKKKIALDAGADFVIVSKHNELEVEIRKYLNGEGVDVILDAIGGETTEKSLNYLNKYGRIVIYGDSSGMPAYISSKSLHASGKSIIGFSIGSIRNDRPDLLKEIANEVINLIEEDKIKICIGATFTLDQAVLAHELIESRKSTGKIVINVHEE